MYEKLKQLILDLEAMNLQPFIGYGNPDAKLLIVGKECTEPNGTDGWKKFFEPNFRQWKDSFDDHGFGYTSGEEPYDFEHGNFHPINPFFRLVNKKQSGKKEVGRPGPTHYYYQRLIDKLRTYAKPDHKNSEYIDFFEDCFITELNDICRPNDKKLKKWQHNEIEQHIKDRFDWMRRTNFFNQFKVVILACGPYANTIKRDEKLRTDLFGKAFVAYCHQLSYWDKSLDDKITVISPKLYL